MNRYGLTIYSLLYRTYKGIYSITLFFQTDRKKAKGVFWTKFRGKSPHHTNPQATGSTAKDVATWGTLEVCTWLETLQLGEYTETFIRNDIRGRELLTLARRDIKELGVTKVGHVKRILQAIKDLNQS